MSVRGFVEGPLFSMKISISIGISISIIIRKFLYIKVWVLQGFKRSCEGSIRLSSKHHKDLSSEPLKPQLSAGHFEQETYCTLSVAPENTHLKTPKPQSKASI